MATRVLLVPEKVSWYPEAPSHIHVCSLEIHFLIAKAQIGATQGKGKGVASYGLCIAAVIAILDVIVAICCQRCIGYSPKSRLHTYVKGFSERECSSWIVVINPIGNL